MEEGQLQKIQGWFKSLDQKVETIQSGVKDLRENSATKQQLDNRFQALLTAMTNLHHRVESYKDQTDTEIVLIKHALHDMETQVKQLQQRVFGS